MIAFAGGHCTQPRITAW